MRDLPGLLREYSRGRVSRRQFLQHTAALGLSATAAGALLPACGSADGDGAAAEPATMSTVKPDRLHLYTWSEYLAPAIRQAFQDQTGIEIVETYYDDNEALLAKLKAGATGYDLIVPSDYMVQIMIKSGLLQPLDMSLLPNFVNVLPRFQHPPFDPETDGRKYSVPWTWGTTGIGMRRDKVTGTVDAWSDLWDSTYAGSLNMLNDERETLGATLKMLGHSLNTTNKSELDEATQQLIAQRPLVRAYDSINMKRSLLAGVSLVHTWNGEALLAIEAIGSEKVAYVLPKEGFTVWVDNLCVPRGAPSPYAAHLFIDFICDPAVAAELAGYIGYLSPSAAAGVQAGASRAVKENTPSAGDLERGEVINDVGDFAREYTDAWARVKSA